VQAASAAPRGDHWRLVTGPCDLAFLTPSQTPLAVLKADGTWRLQALYSPTGKAASRAPDGGGDPYPKTWAGYLRYPDAGLYALCANMAETTIPGSLV
jgi:hypothetical protein